MTRPWIVFACFGIALLALPRCKEEAAVCGNGVKEGTEVCDGTAFGDDNCQHHNYLSGLLTCSPLCDVITFEHCNGGCGNGVVETVTAQGTAEECDITVLPQNCEVNGYDYGDLKCNADCTLDFSECKNAVCGNGDVEPVEDCDFDTSGAPILGGDTCEDHDFNAGDLACFAAGTENECHFDTSGCETWVCGNGVIDPGENCDFDSEGNPVLDDETCVTRGYDYGDLGCVPVDDPDVAKRCKWDVSQCMEYVCGNGVVEGDEECEVGVAITATCADEGFQSGVLACMTDDSCRFDLSGCVDGCGNGVKEGTEECDGDDVGTDTCDSVSGGTLTGELGCKTDCTYDLTLCIPV
jgi:hypothetical protein